MTMRRRLQRERGRLDEQLQVTKEPPPTFLWHTRDDSAVKVDNSLEFANALLKNGVPYDLHIYQTGRHGLGLGVSGYTPGVTDESKLSQILRNFISNAVKYTESGTVNVTASVLDRALRISVRDTGIGIAPESLPMVFEEFVQIRNPLQKRTKGSGIGLPISMRLAQLLGGSIEVESTPGQGSTFTVILPEVAVEEGAIWSSAEPGAARVLIIDDVEVDRYTLRALLPAGCEVMETSDAMGAVETASRARPSVIFLDLGMPVLDGFETCQRIRSMPGGDHIAIMATTGWGQDADRQRSAQCGFDAHLVKPADPALLLARLDALH
jgi:CheY-like chemotaxis protein